MSAAERRGATPDRVTERVIVMDADAASRRAAELAEEAAAAREVPSAPATAFLAIDLGASRLAAAIVDADGDVVVRDRVATPPRSVWPVLTQLVGRVMAANPGEILPGACGVTCPGPPADSPARGRTEKPSSPALPRTPAGPSPGPGDEGRLIRWVAPLVAHRRAGRGKAGP